MFNNETKVAMVTKTYFTELLEVILLTEWTPPETSNLTLCGVRRIQLISPWFARGDCNHLTIDETANVQCLRGLVGCQTEDLLWG